MGDRASQGTRPGVRRLLYRPAVPMTLIVVLAIATAVAAWFEVGRLLDDQAQRATAQRVSIAVDVEARHLADLVVDYSYWDEAWRRLVETPDEEWARDNIGSYMTEYLGINLAMVVHADDRPGFVFVDALVQNPAPRIVDFGKLPEAIAKARQDTRIPTPVTLVLSFRGDWFLAAIDTFVPEYEHQRDADGSLLLIARRIDQELIDDISENYRVPGLRFAEAAPSPQADLAVAISGDTPEPGAPRLTWRAPSPSSSALVSARPALSGMAFAFVVLTAWFGYSTLRQARSRVESAKVLERTDQLTGLGNRNHFFAAGAPELARAAREQAPLSLLLLDINDFRGINDRLGHAVADDVLRDAASNLAARIRSYDVPARLGNDEFAVLLPGTPLTEAQNAAERIRSGIDAERPVSVTVRIAVTEYRNGDSLDSMLARAGSAMRGDDGHGDHCVVVD